jgi:hypothetical protein
MDGGSADHAGAVICRHAGECDPVLADLTDRQEEGGLDRDRRGATRGYSNAQTRETRLWNTPGRRPCFVPDSFRFAFVSFISLSSR